MSRPRNHCLHGCLILTLALTLTDAFLWPRLTPYYYPLPYTSPSSSSSGPPSSGNQYSYDWSQFNQNYPHSSVLYPSNDPSYIVPPVPSLPSSGPSRGSMLGALFQKPLLRWKLSKFGSPSSGCSSPCSPCSSSSSSSGLSGLSFPSLSSLRSSLTSSLTSASLNPTSPTYPPCSSPPSTVCCTSIPDLSSRPQYIHTNVVPYTYDRHTSQISYPSTNYLYAPNSPSRSGYPSLSSSSSSSSSSGPSVGSYTPQASEQIYDFVSSK